MSWLKIVAHRIDSLDGRVDTMYENKWMQIAIDKVVDVMTEKQLMSDFYKKDLSHRKLLCNKSVQVKFSLIYIITHEYLGNVFIKIKLFILLYKI